MKKKKLSVDNLRKVPTFYRLYWVKEHMYLSAVKSMGSSDFPWVSQWKGVPFCCSIRGKSKLFADYPAESYIRGDIGL
jgi:hypothetical protein